MTNDKRDTKQRRHRPTQWRAEESEGGKFIEGYFAVFGDVYELWPGATESIAATAFDGALTDDIRALVDHETHLVLGRTKAGTLELRADNQGLWGRVRINEQDSDAMNLYARVQRGDVDQCSFGFDILKETTEVRGDGSVHWTIESVKLWEVSIVTFPAYEKTSVSARKQEYEEIQKRKVQEWRVQMKERYCKHGSKTTDAADAAQN